MPVKASIILDSGSFMESTSNLWYDSWRVGYFQCGPSCPDVRVYADGQEVETFRLGNGNCKIDVVHVDAAGKGIVGVNRSNTVANLLRRSLLYEPLTLASIDDTTFDCILHFHSGDFRPSMVKTRRFKEVDDQCVPTSNPPKELGPIAHDVVVSFLLEDGDQLKFLKSGADIWSSTSIAKLRDRLEIEVLADDTTACKYYIKPFGGRTTYWVPNQGQPPPTGSPP